MSNKIGPKAKNMMYVQQIKHLPSGIKGIEDLIKKIESLNPKKYAAILHNQDYNSDGKKEPDHIHCMISFDNARSIQNIAKQIGDKEQYIQRWNGSALTGYAYLTHNTKDCYEKYHYSPHEVTASFDYTAELNKYLKREGRKESEVSIKIRLDQLLNGDISSESLINSLDAWSYSKYKKQIQDTIQRKLELDAIAWKKAMIESNSHTEVIWIYGDAGAGKSSLAKAIAEKRGEPYFVSGSSRDYFQQYAGQHIAILDDLRPRTGGMEYSDLLRLLDPYNINEFTMGPSRYSDKILALSLIIITCPYSPKEFYNHLFPEDSQARLRALDSFYQLQRRIELVIQMTHTAIVRAEYDGKTYLPDTNSFVTNKYSIIYRDPSINNVDGKTLFNKLFFEESESSKQP